MIRVRVPATLGNLGPGFDTLGLAVRLYNDLEVEEAEELTLQIEGEGAQELPRDSSHLTLRGLKELFRRRGHPLPGLHLRQNNRIPLARGLGSSAAAAVAGILAGARWLGEECPADALDLAAALEGHPDNAAAALRGGLVAAALSRAGALASSLPLHECWRVALAVPEDPVATERARGRLPQEIPHADAVHNLSRMALLIAGLADGRSDLWEAVTDRLHQPYRASLVPGFRQALQAARRAGAAGAFLSGAGPAVAAFVDSRQADAAGVARAMAIAMGSRCRALALEVDREGARFL